MPIPAPRLMATDSPVFLRRAEPSPFALRFQANFLPMLKNPGGSLSNWLPHQHYDTGYACKIVIRDRRKPRLASKCLKRICLAGADFEKCPAMRGEQAFEIADNGSISPETILAAV
jgi:hypothetical protein